MTRRLTFTALGAIAAILTLSGCEKTKEQFDFSKKPPDEFAVVKREPLEMPPDFSLRPPTPGAARPQEQPGHEVEEVSLSNGLRIEGLDGIDQSSRAKHNRNGSVAQTDHLT